MASGSSMEADVHKTRLRRRRSIDHPISFLTTVNLARIMQTAKEQNPDERRIVLLGKTGAGKSATANTILGKKRFKSELNPSSVTTKSEMRQGLVAGKKVSIVDTPGLFDTFMSAEDLGVEIGRSVYLSSPGPHAFLYVLQINLRFTEQEEEVVQKFEMMFGEEMRKYTIVLFTQGDQLEGKSADTLIKKNKSLNKLVEQCGGGYHVFNNKDLSNREQVTQLMENIDTMVKKNGGSCYCNQMFEDAARFKQEEEERRMEEEARKQKEEQQRQDEIDRIRKDLEEEMRKEKEREIKMAKERKLKEEQQKQEEIGKTRKVMEEKIRKKMEMEIKIMKDRKLKQEQQKQEHIERIRKEMKEKIRKGKEREMKMTERKRKIKSFTLKEEEYAMLDMGLNRLLQKHGDHLTTAGAVGTVCDRSVRTGGVMAVVGSGALIGSLIGIAGGPVGIAIGAAIGATVGALLGAAGEIL